MSTILTWKAAALLISVCAITDFTLAQAPASEAEIVKIMEQMFQDFSRKDLTKVLARWSNQSPYAASFKLNVQISFAGEDDIRFTDLSFSRWNIKADGASVRVKFTNKWRDRETGKQEQKARVWDINLVKDQAGAWKLWQWSEPRQMFDAELLRLESKQERMSLLKSESELIDPSMVLALAEEGDREGQSGNLSKAWKYINTACDMAEVLRSENEIAVCYEYRGTLLGYEYRVEPALNNFEMALSHFRGSHNVKHQWLTLLKIGNLHLLTGKYSDALDRYKEAQILGSRLGDPAISAIVFKQIGIVSQSLGKYADALANYEKSLQLAEQAIAQNSKERNGRLEKASTLVNIGNVYLLVGKYPNARTAYANAIELYTEMGDINGEAGARINLGHIHRMLKDYYNAMSQYKASLSAGRELQDLRLITTSLNGMGHAKLMKGEYREAIADYEESLNLAQQGNIRETEGATLISIGYAHFLQKDFEKALDSYEKAQTIASTIGDVDLAFRAANNIGDLYLVRGQCGNAIKQYEAAVQKIEYVRSETKVPSFQTAFFERYTSPYHSLAECAFRSGSKEDAFIASERAKARTLVDIMKDGGTQVSKSISKIERREEQRLTAKITHLTIQINNLKSKTSAALKAAEDLARQMESYQQQLTMTRQEYENFQARLFASHPGLRLRRGQYAPLSLIDLNKRLFANHPGICLLSYLISENSASLYIITANDNPAGPALLTIYPLKNFSGFNLTEEELAEKIERLRSECSNPDGVFQTDARDLYDLLIAPAERLIAGKRHLIILPDGSLHTLPFQALITKRERFLLEDHVITYAPSVTALMEMIIIENRRKRQAGLRRIGLLAFGSRTFPHRIDLGELQHAEEAVKEIGILYGKSARVFAGRAATESKVKALITQTDYLLFVTHGELNNAAPMYSDIVLRKDRNQDGILHAQEIINMNLGSSLVVLSACETALGYQARGEGILGLTWAFFVAGSPSAIATQWKVDHLATSSLILRFFKELKPSRNTGQPIRINRAESLCKAQLALLKSKDFSHPYYWSPFVLYGDWQ